MSLNLMVDQALAEKAEAAASDQKPGHEGQEAAVGQEQGDADKKKAVEKMVKFVKGLQSNITRALQNPNKKDKEIEPFVLTPYPMDNSIKAAQNVTKQKCWDFNQAKLAQAHEKKVKAAAEAKKEAEADMAAEAQQQAMFVAETFFGSKEALDEMHGRDGDELESRSKEVDRLQRTKFKLDVKIKKANRAYAESQVRYVEGWAAITSPLETVLENTALAAFPQTWPALLKKAGIVPHSAAYKFGSPRPFGQAAVERASTSAQKLPEAAASSSSSSNSSNSIPRKPLPEAAASSSSSSSSSNIFETTTSSSSRSWGSSNSAPRTKEGRPFHEPVNKDQASRFHSARDRPEDSSSRQSYQAYPSSEYSSGNRGTQRGRKKAWDYQGRDAKRPSPFEKRPSPSAPTPRPIKEHVPLCEAGFSCPMPGKCGFYHPNEQLMHFLAHPPPAGPPPQEAPSVPAAPTGPPPQAAEAAAIDDSAVVAAMAQLEAEQVDNPHAYSEVDDEEEDDLSSDDEDLEKKN